MTANRPTGPVAVPEAVVRLAAADEPIDAVWRNELRGVIYRIAADWYVTWAPVQARAAENQLDPALSGAPRRNARWLHG